MHRARRLVVLAVALAIPLAGCADAKSDAPGGTSGTIKVGLITKFPVDFYDTMVDAVKQYDAAHADVEVVYGQGKSGTDDEGEIAVIENMITQQVKAIAITPTSPNVQGALDKAVKAGIKVVLIDNDIPGWSGKSSLVATTTSPAASWPGNGWPSSCRPARRSRSCRGGWAIRRWTTGSRA